MLLNQTWYLYVLIFYMFCCCLHCSVTQSSVILCNPVECSTPGFPVLHHLPEFAQTHDHQISDASQPSHPPSSPSLPAFNLIQPSGFFPMSQLFTSGGQIIGASASVLPKNIQGWFPLGLTGLSPWCPRDSQESSLVRVFSKASTLSILLSLLYGLTLTSIHDYWKNHSFDYTDLCQQRDVSAF